LTLIARIYKMKVPAENIAAKLYGLRRAKRKTEKIIKEITQNED
jgi:hypothetical protein